MSNRIVTESTPTQVAHPWRSVVRTFVAALVGVALAWVARTVGVDLTEWDAAIVDSLTAAAWTVGTGVVQWILTLPRLQPLLRVIGLDTGVTREAPRRTDGTYRATDQED